MTEQQLGTVVIGGSQAGLAVGYYLKQRGLPFVILDENDRVGAAWRKRWDSLRLFTPGRYNGLPGMPFPGSPGAYPTKDETADYLDAYARAFELPVRTGVKVDRLAKTGDRFEVTCGQQALSAENVVVATGAFNNPRVPSFARELDQSIVQLHSKEYRNPSQIQKGAVLVVGAGNSGAEIAMELAPHHQTWLSGPDTGQEPARAGTRLDHLLTPMMWFVATRLTVKTALGRKLRDHFLDPPRGIPLGRVRRKDFAPAGIERVPRMTGVRNGYPALENGRVLEVSNVIWCTGFRPDYHWIDLSLPTRNGVPIHDRGIVESCPGLYFIGLLFLYSLSSALVGGVGRDAEHIVDHIVSTRLSKKDNAVARATTAGRQYA
ncbi:MAG TPA: NAD(P)-binding domain-containing protein [Vicinamibacterales bacterium]|nr:NAD(P)-binding domain-containing protein [Vicinamibacterales bacterium]